MRARVAVAALALLGLVPGGARAQAAPEHLVIDRVIGMVGNHPILQSQVDEQVFVLTSQPGSPLPKTAEDSTLLRKQIMNDMIDDELLVQEAQRDTSIKVTEQEIGDAVDQLMKNARGRFQTDVDYKAELRKSGFQSPEEYRRFLLDQQRREFLRNKLLDKRRSDGKIKSVPPTEREMRDYFALQKGRLGQRPATISYHEIIVAPKPGHAARDSVLRLADSIVIELRKGADFATAAKRFSMDPGSKDLGGSLGWTRRGGGWVPQFERVAFLLRPGVVSDPVETPFGYHIIQVERVQPGEVLARHILLIPTIGADSIAAAKATAERVHDALIAGARADSLQKLYHDPSEQREITETPVDRLQEPFKSLVANAKPGDVSAVTPIEVGPVTKYAVLQVATRREAGEVLFDDVKDKVRAQLGEQLGIRRYLERLRSAAYVEIRPT